jgi:hypothetical protein
MGRKNFNLLRKKAEIPRNIQTFDYTPCRIFYAAGDGEICELNFSAAVY